MDNNSLTKRVRVEKTEDEGKIKMEQNPYLAHWNDDNGYNDDYGYGNGRNGVVNGKLPVGSPLKDFRRRETTAQQAFKAEDGDNNPFTGEPHSEQYFSILKARRNLPVHKQRYVYFPFDSPWPSLLGTGS